jgi:hypothetical protein
MHPARLATDVITISKGSLGKSKAPINVRTHNPRREKNASGSLSGPILMPRKSHSPSNPIEVHRVMTKIALSI